MNDFLQSIKAGDRVWISESSNRNRRLETIERLTPTQILTDDGRRYRLMDGNRVGGYSYSRIRSLATAQECAAWDAEQERERRAQEAREAAAYARNLEQQRLSALFPENAWATDGEKGTWEVHATGLTTAEVEALAVKLKGAENG